MSRIAGSCGRLCLKSLEAAKFFSKVTVSFYLITRSIWKFQLFYIIANKPGRMIYLQKLSCKQVLESTWNKPELWSVQFSRSVGSNSLRPHGLQHTRLPCPSPTPGACSNSCPLSQSLLKLMSIKLVMLSNHLLLCHPLLLPPSFFPSIRSFQMSQFFASDGQSIRASASTFQWIFRTDFL